MVKATTFRQFRLKQLKGGTVIWRRIFVAGVQVTQKDGTDPVCGGNCTMVDSLAAALDEGENTGSLAHCPVRGLYRPRRFRRVRGFIYLQKAITEAMGPMAEILMEMVREGKMRRMRNDG